MRGMLKYSLAALLLLSLLPVDPAPAFGQSVEAERGRSGLPIPRFVSLGTNEARMRAGPGRDYPAKWMYVREGLPLEVVDEWGIHRKVRDPDGQEGWMDKALLSGARTGMIVGKVTTARARPELDAPPVWRAEPGVIVRVQLCESGWCRVQVDGRAGFVKNLDLWGVYKDEEIN
ncbi:SH3 domain-containing protein [Pacificimonas sp. ICDLI1SI03]|jgi:SH3-like domain-containing protein